MISNESVSLALTRTRKKPLTCGSASKTNCRKVNKIMFKTGLIANPSDNVLRHVVGILSHTDLDGYGCEIVVRASSSDGSGTFELDSQIMSSHVNYDELNTLYVESWVNKLETICMVNYDVDIRETDPELRDSLYAIISDLNINSDIARFIRDYNDSSNALRIVVIDHHPQSPEVREILQHDAYIVSEWVNDNGIKVPTCATKLVYQFMYELNDGIISKNSMRLNETLDDFVMRVNNWDTFITDIMADHFTVNLNEYLYLVGGNAFVTQALRVIQGNRGVNRIISKDVLEIIKHKHAAESHEIYDAICCSFECPEIMPNEAHPSCRIIVSSRLNATSVNLYLVDHDDHDRMPVFMLFNPVSGKTSFRSRGDIDASAIAKHFGGNGHKNAAGALVDCPETVATIMKQYYSIMHMIKTGESAPFTLD